MVLKVPLLKKKSSEDAQIQEQKYCRMSRNTIFLNQYKQKDPERKRYMYHVMKKRNKRMKKPNPNNITNMTGNGFVHCTRNAFKKQGTLQSHISIPQKLLFRNRS